MESEEDPVQRQIPADSEMAALCHDVDHRGCAELWLQCSGKTDHVMTMCFVLFGGMYY